MQNIRIGNDIPIIWRVYRLGDPEMLQNEEVSVRLLDSYMKPVPFEYYVEENVITGVFEGRNQKRTGAYTLKLVKNYGKPEMVTIDEVSAFTIVTHSYQEGGSSDDPGLTINTVSLSSEITVASNGIDGASAYDIALRKGFVGTEAQWLESLVGADGKSAYLIAVEQGFSGTKAEWLLSLKGDNGRSAYEMAVALGEFEGTKHEYLESLKGADGKNAYDYAVEQGFEGTEEEWIESLHGKDGEDGKSAYDIVKENTDYEGTEEEFANEQIKKVVTSDKVAAFNVDISNPDESSSAVLYTPQVLKEAEKVQARVNINAANLDNEIILEDADIEAMAADPTLLTSAVRVTPQTWTQAEKTQAQQNIGVADEARVIYLEEKMAILDSTGVTVIGDVNTLTTDAKDYVVDAINEVDAHTDTNTEHIGEMDDLEVKNADGTNVGDLVTAINILKNANGMSMIEEAVPNLDMVKTYSIYNGVDEDGEDILVGQIDIPLDKVALEGEVIVANGTEIIGTDVDGNTLRTEPGELYIKLTIKNEATPIYIALKSLDYTAKQPNATAGETVLQVQVAIDKTKREISASIGEDTITHTELDKKTEHELDFTGYEHNYDNAAHADYGKAQLTTTAQTLRGAVNEHDAEIGEVDVLPFRDVTDPADPKYPTITENIKKLYDVTQGAIKYEGSMTYANFDTNYLQATYDADAEDNNPAKLIQITDAYDVMDAVDTTKVVKHYQAGWYALGISDGTQYEWQYLDNADGLIGNLASLTTTEKTTIVDAINELDYLQGDKDNLPYRDETDPADIKVPTITENIKALYDAVQNCVHYIESSTYADWKTNYRDAAFDADAADRNPIKLVQITDAYDIVDDVTDPANPVVTAHYQAGSYMLGISDGTAYAWQAIDNADGLIGDLAELKTEAKDLVVNAINELWVVKGTTHVVENLPDITNTTVLAGISEKDIYIWHEIFEVLDADGNHIHQLNPDGSYKVDGAGNQLFETEEFYTPYRLSDDRSKWLCLYHRHEHETTAIDFDADITW